MHESQFGLHMRFFVEQLFRVLAPGCIAAIHIQQLLRYKIQHGFMGVRDFRGAVYTIFELGGFQPHGEVAIVKNPQAVAQRLKLHSLLFATAKRDSRALAPAMNDYVLFFRKPGEGTRIKGLRDEKTNPDGWFTTDEWIKWAHGCWTDIRETDVLGGWRKARDSDEEKHVCPLQLEVIRRCVRLYSAPGQMVLDPFMGIGSTACVCVEQGRRAVGGGLRAQGIVPPAGRRERALGRDATRAVRGVCVRDAGGARTEVDPGGVSDMKQQLHEGRLCDRTVRRAVVGAVRQDGVHSSLPQPGLRMRGYQREQCGYRDIEALRSVLRARHPDHDLGRLLRRAADRIPFVERLSANRADRVGLWYLHGCSPTVVRPTRPARHAAHGYTIGANGGAVKRNRRNTSAVFRLSGPKHRAPSPCSPVKGGRHETQARP
jgi:hypothetical protein